MERKGSSNKGKMISVLLLYLTAIVICVAGLSFSILSFRDHISLSILSHPLPGYVFGIVILFLGIRYMISVFRLREELYRTNSTFSFGNFRRRAGKDV